MRIPVDSEYLHFGFFQSSDAAHSSDGSLDAAKIAELESRLAAQTSETERLKVCDLAHILLFYSWHLVILSHPVQISFICVSVSPFTVLPPLFPPHSSSPSSPLFQEEARGLSEGRPDLEQQLASATSTVAILQTEKTKLQTEVQESKKEQDDLLMLLADQDLKIHNLRKTLKDLGQTVNYLTHSNLLRRKRS